MNERHLFPTILIFGVLAAALFSGCAEVTEMGSQMAQEAGVRRRDGQPMACLISEFLRTHLLFFPAKRFLICPA